MPVAVIAKFTTAPGKRDEVVDALREIVAAARDEPGTLIYSMHVDKAAEDVIWFYELYTDDAALAAHGGSEAMKAVGPKLAGKTAGRAELFLLDPVEAKGLPV